MGFRANHISSFLSRDRIETNGLLPDGSFAERFSRIDIHENHHFNICFRPDISGYHLSGPIGGFINDNGMAILEHGKVSLSRQSNTADLGAVMGGIGRLSQVNENRGLGMAAGDFGDVFNQPYQFPQPYQFTQGYIARSHNPYVSPELLHLVFNRHLGEILPVFGTWKLPHKQPSTSYYHYVQNFLISCEQKVNGKR
jgi:hypothetical protein